MHQDSRNTRQEPYKPLIGAHMSASGGAYQALLRGADIGCTAIQLFTSNQRQWHSKEIADEAVKRWKQAQEETRIYTTISHNNYLTNLGSGKEEVLQKSIQSFGEEIERCQLLGIPYLNFHPGVATGNDEEACLRQIVKSLRSFSAQLENNTLRLLLETTAGQGNSVGHRFEHMAYIIQEVRQVLPIGICIDTCHIFAAGYDISTQEGFEAMLCEFDKTIGLDYLQAFHVNDSLRPMGSRKDRHAALGQGEIGLEAFRCIASHPRTKQLPMILETPEPSRYQQELTLLKNYTRRAYR